MADQKTMLCVGGPKNGMRYTILNGLGFLVSIRDAAGKLTFADYREQTFRTPQGDVSFWVPFEQTPFETMRMLCEAFEQLANERGIAGENPPTTEIHKQHQ